MRFLHISICGFIVKIEFHTSRYPENEKIMRDLIVYAYKPLLLKSVNREADYSIKIKDADWIDTILIKRQNMNFINLYKSSSEREITTSYYASPILFQLMFMQILEELSKNNGILIHASCAIVKGKASLFCGVSGAGKSTLITLLRDSFNPIAEDSVYLTKKGDKLLVYQTPFMEKLPWIKRGNKTFEVGKIFFLIKDKSCKALEIKSKEDSFEEFMKRFAASKKTHKKQIDLSLELVIKTPCYYLRFNKNSEELTKTIASLP